jgi:hypothetical protein
MACLPIPSIPVPELPAPLTIAPSFPGQSFDPELCCKVLDLPLTIPPIGILATLLNPAVNTVIANAIKSVQDYLDKLPHDCPKELQRPTS